MPPASSIFLREVAAAKAAATDITAIRENATAAMFWTFHSSRMLSQLLHPKRTLVMGRRRSNLCQARPLLRVLRVAQ